LGQCTDYAVTNNIVASAWHSGFRLPAYKCGQSPVHTGNVAHSTAGLGVIVYRGAGDCSEFSDFKGYKTRLATVQMGGGIGAFTNKVRNIVTIDSYYGLMALGRAEGRVEVEDVIFYGGKDMKNLDCPDKSNCSVCIERRGLMIPTFGSHNKIMNLAPKHIPKMHSAGGAWGGSSLF